MNGLKAFFETTGGILMLFFESMYWCKSCVSGRDRLFVQMLEIGNNTLPVAGLIALFIGGVIALQSGPPLAAFGLENSIGGIVGLSLVKEIGPVMGAMLIVGRVGSAMAAELGAMSVYDEIDALRAMDISPARFLVMPRVLATVVTLPVLVVYMMVIGWLGGAIVSYTNPGIDVSFATYYQNISQLVHFKQVINGLIKSMIFGIIISNICCYIGLRTRGGPKEIASSVTRAVVLSFITILISDYLITRFLIALSLD